MDLLERVKLNLSKHWDRPLAGKCWSSTVTRWVSSVAIFLHLQSLLITRASMSSPSEEYLSVSVNAVGGIFVFSLNERCSLSDAWGCFDEFNRLDEAVLSAVSMQIQVIQDALKSGASSLVLLDRTIEINPNSGIFVTLNPAGKGYGGRSKLPDNLKQLFRPVAMSKPNNELIAEVLLYSDGFKQAQLLAKKLVALFNLSRELLTTQQHYDWGLRALKTVLKGCGTLLRNAKANKGKAMSRERWSMHSPRGHLVEISAKYEAQLVVQAARINTLSKLTFGDSKRFDGLLRDIFPGIDLRDIEYETLRLALHEIFTQHHLSINDMQVVSRPTESSVLLLVDQLDSQSIGTLRTTSTTDGCGHCRSIGIGEVGAVENAATRHAEGWADSANLRDESQVDASNSIAGTHRYRYERVVWWSPDRCFSGRGERTSR